MIEKCENKGNPQRILDFINTHEALSEESAGKITAELKKSRKRLASISVFS